MYDSLSKYYDLFDEDDSAARAKYLAGFLPSGGNGADLGCGTGGVTIELARLGFSVVGFDSSPGMLARAYERAASERISVPFVLRDALRFKIGDGLDFVAANKDVVNYAAKPRGFFKRAYDALRPGGVFVFDISTEYKLRRVLGDNAFTQTCGDVTYVWENSLRGGAVDMFLTFFERGADGRYDKSEDEQTQYIHGERELVDLLSSVGFSKVKTYGYGTRSKPKSDCERIAFVCER